MTGSTTRGAKTPDTGRMTGARRRLLLVGMTAVMILLAYRAFQLQVLQRETWRSQATSQQARQTSLPAPRGTIYDRDGVPLAASEETFAISIAPHELLDVKETQKLLQKYARLTRAEAQKAVDQKRGWVVLPGRFDADTRQGLHGLRGVYVERVLRRFYPRGAIAPELIGAVTAEGKALSGLELELNNVLRGREGSAVVKRAARGPIPGAMQEMIEPTAGQDVVLTIDADLQEIAREALVHAIGETSAASGEIVMADPRTGEILAAVTSKPGVHTWRAVTEPYEPGSTLKPFAVATLLAEKRAQLTDSVFAENGVFIRDGRTIRDVHEYGWLSVADALKHSSNIALAKLSDRLDPETQYTYLRAFGFGSPTAIAYPSESGGLLRRPNRWSKYSRASLAIGYEISVTPLQMVMAYGALANGGVLMEPRLVREVRSREGQVTATFAPRAVRRVVSEKTADELRAVLTDVVEAGTGQAADLGPFAVAGKTGTARAYGDGHYGSGNYYSSFAGFFPADDPQIVFLVKLDSPRGKYYGGLTAAPVTRATLEAALAALSTPLDKRVVAASAPPPLATAQVSAPEVQLRPAPPSGPFIFALDAGPLRHYQQPNSPDESLAPDVMGLPLRDAVRRLHADGFHVKVEGSGVVSSMWPAAGANLPKGALVRLSAAEIGS